MVYKFKPLELSLDFEDRDYELGDTVDVQVDLVPNGDVHVREARIDLVCEQRYTRNERGVVIGMGRSIAGGNMFTSTDYVPSTSMVNERAESYVHSKVVFLSDTALGGGRPTTHRTNLKIQPNLPERLEDALELERDANSAWSFKWRLLAYVDIVRGRNPQRQRTIKVMLPRTSGSERVGARPPMTTPRKSTGPAT